MRVISMVFCVTVLMVLSVSGCGAQENEGDTGTLMVRMVVGNSGTDTESGGLTARVGQTHAGVPIVDIKNIMYELSVTSDLVVEGQPDDLTWYPVYTGTTEKYQSELELSAVLPVGMYKAVRIVMSDYIIWVCEVGAKTVEMQDSNGSGSADGKTINVFSSAGLYTLDENSNFKLNDNGEKLGTEFEIRTGETTVLTIRSNMNTLDWVDADDDGDWSDGDIIDNWTVLPGTDTMADFIVEYE